MLQVKVPIFFFGTPVFSAYRDGRYLGCGKVLLYILDSAALLTQAEAHNRKKPHNDWPGLRDHIELHCPSSAYLYPCLAISANVIL
jgi:hypothetical protein